MTEKISEQDLLFVKSLLEKILNITDIKAIEKMNGMTNRSYKVDFKCHSSLVVRIPGEGTSNMINRLDEYKSTKLAYKLGIDAELLYFGEDGTKIMHYIDNAKTMSPEDLRQNDKIQMIADIFRILHNCNEDTCVPFNVFDMADTYEKIINLYRINMFDDYQNIKQKIMNIKNRIDSHGIIKKVPCHNDSLCENWVYGEGKLFLIDWEYAGMNDPMWDLADISIEASYNEKQDSYLLKNYLQKEPTIYEKERFFANKLYLDYLWTLWAKTRVPFSEKEMEQYALERYTRLKTNLNKFIEFKNF